jgi:ankyrin repeat protein
MKRSRLRWLALAALVGLAPPAQVFVGLDAYAEDGAPSARAPSEAPTPPDPAAPPNLKGPIIPRPEPLEPRAFTLADRYLDAARRGDIDMLKLCIEKGVDDRVKDGFARDALLLAASDGKSLAIVKLLRARGLPIDAPDVRGIAALGYAAGNGHVELVSYLLEHGAKVDRKDVQQMTPLVHAVLGGSKESVARLIEAGADVNSRDQFHDTPLIAACNKGVDEIAKLLVEKGADPSLLDQEGRTARQRAAAASIYCRELPAAPAKPGV